MTDAELAREAVRLSGLSQRRFARYLVGRSERTMTNWLAGHPMPDAARDWLTRFVSLTERERRETVARLTTEPDSDP